jgi:hypothetical protein
MDSLFTSNPWVFSFHVGELKKKNIESSIDLHIVDQTMKRTNKYLLDAGWKNQGDLIRVSCCWTTQSLTASRPRLVAWILQDCVTLAEFLAWFSCYSKILGNSKAVIYGTYIFTETWQSLIFTIVGRAMKNTRITSMLLDKSWNPYDYPCFKKNQRRTLVIL